jgi:hypothetical protein
VPGSPRLDEDDREAARTLLGKKKRKKRAVPFYQRAWFTGAVTAAVLVVIAWIFYTAVLKAPSPESLYDRASTLIDQDDYTTARDGPIATFLRHYADRDDAQARQMRAWADTADLKTRERQMHARRNSVFQPESEAEAHARRALAFEDRGDLDAAAREWQAVTPLKQEQDADQRPWGLVADKYLADIQKARELAEKVSNSVRTEHLRKEKKYVGDTPLEEMAVQAVRSASAGRKKEEKQKWQALRDEARQKEERPWELVAAWKLHELAEAAALQEQPGEKQ